MLYMSFANFVFLQKLLKCISLYNIFSVIMSDSTPKMHRRVMSGDMSSLHTNKHSAINKLTRSYDMSIRSLMSEEFSGRAPLPHAVTDLSKEVSGSELVTDQLPTSHNLLISPKYTSKEGAATAAAVKLLSRTASQPLKKQNSPSKEPGPPQPLKGIHTLPPSLPVSRESTFDSTPQKSPTLSDGGDAKECKVSRKSSLVTADLPEAASSSLDLKSSLSSQVADTSHTHVPPAKGGGEDIQLLPVHTSFDDLVTTDLKGSLYSDNCMH